MASSRAAFAVALATLVGAFAAIDPARVRRRRGLVRTPRRRARRREARTGGEIFWLKIGDSGVNVPGATIPVEIRRRATVSWILLRSRTGIPGRAIGAFGADMLLGNEDDDVSRVRDAHELARGRIRVDGDAVDRAAWITEGIRGAIRADSRGVQCERWYGVSRSLSSAATGTTTTWRSTSLGA